MSGGDERRSSDSTIKLFRKTIKSGVRMRWLIENNNTAIMGDLKDYRWMPV